MKVANVAVHEGRVGLFISEDGKFAVLRLPAERTLRQQIFTLIEARKMAAAFRAAVSILETVAEQSTSEFKKVYSQSRLRVPEKS